MSEYLKPQGDLRIDENADCHFEVRQGQAALSNNRFPSLILEPPTPFVNAPGMTLPDLQRPDEQQNERYLSGNWNYASTEEQSNYASSVFSDSPSHYATSSPVVSPARSASANSIHSRTTVASGRVKKSEPEKNNVKRPLNSFMLYRKDHQHCIPTNNHQSISRIIGDMWRKETAETKNKYDVLAKSERERHQLENPGYKFQPKKKKKDPKLINKGLHKDIRRRNTEAEDEDRQVLRRMLSDNGAPSTQSSTGPAGPSQPHSYRRVSENDQLGLSREPSSLEVYNGHLVYPPVEMDSSVSSHLPPQFAHYGEAFPEDDGQHAELIDQLAASSGFRDPQDWARAQAIPVRAIETPRPHVQPYHRFLSDQRPQHIGLWQQDHFENQQASAQATVGNPRLGLGNGYHLPPTFGEWEDQQTRMQYQLDSMDFPYQGQLLEPEPFGSRALYRQAPLYEPDYGHSFEMECQNSAAFAPGTMYGAWEVDHDRR